MARWEIDIQLPDGGFQGGMWGTEQPAASTFVTGQVLFGLIAIYEEHGDLDFLAAATKAGDFLLDCLDERGRFFKGFSAFCAPGPKAYEIRTAWALAKLSQITQSPQYANAAHKMADFTLSCQATNGWFDINDLDDHSQPLTHTVGYTLEGLEGLAALLGRTDCADALVRSLTHIAALVPDDGALPGRWLRDWSPAVTWSCLTGDAQIAGVLVRQHYRSGDRTFLDASKRLLSFVAYTQAMANDSIPALRGGIRGAFPFNGEYGQWCVLNWATKFYADSVMDYLSIGGHE